MCSSIIAKKKKKEEKANILQLLNLSGGVVAGEFYVFFFLEVILKKLSDITGTNVFFQRDLLHLKRLSSLDCTQRFLKSTVTGHATF